jgi:tetratricopeptide (TPR) repeat protein
MTARHLSVAARLLIWATVAVAALALQVGVAAAGKVVIVAPLHDAAPAADADAAEGVTDLVAGVLAENVTVIAGEKLDQVLREHSLSVKALADEASAPRVGKLLKAQHLLTGSVFRRNGRVEFALQLLDVQTGAVVKGLSAGGPADSLLATASDLSRQCAKALQIASELPSGEKADSRRLARERFFLEALGFYHAGDYDRAIMNCLKVIELDPNDEKARLRLAESFFAAGDTEQARITLHRALQLFPKTTQGVRIQSLLNRLSPAPIQAVEKTTIIVPLPEGWPADARVAFELSWEGQPARRDEANAGGGTVRVKMPGARLPLDLELKLSTRGQDPVTQTIRLWPSDTGLRQPENRPLVVVDPGHATDGLLKGLKHKHYTSCRSIPTTNSRLVIIADDSLSLTEEQATALTGFVSSGGHLAILGRLPNGTEIAGLRQATVWWPVSHAWRPTKDSAAWSYIPTRDVVSAFSRVTEGPCISGGAAHLAAGERDVSLISDAVMDKGHVLWVSWPGTADASDPRYARLLALAIGDAARPVAE